VSNEILPGTIDCDPGTLSGSIFAALNGLVAPADQPLVEFAFKQIAFGVASGWFDNVVDSITDLNYLRVDAGAIVGDAGGGGGGAPTTAEYLVGASNGSLSAERLVTNSSTLTWDLATPGQVSASVPTATTAAAGVVELATDGEAIADRVVQGNDSRLTNARTPTAHASSHQNGGSDEISVTGLSGLLADGQTPLAHSASHSDGASDPIDVTNLAGYPGGGTTFLRDDGTFATPAGGSGIAAGAAITLGYIP
jgi:hypothetical protein